MIGADRMRPSLEAGELDFEQDHTTMVQGLCEPAAAGSSVCGIIPVHFLWPNTQFAGAYDRDMLTGINDFVAAPESADLSDFSCPVDITNPNTYVCPRVESFHPTAEGTGRCAEALEDVLTGLVYE
jgi:hypothetical protein